MDVHHHTHHAHREGQTGKHLKTYLFEFFMLFLAVFCGYLAEYFLEHKFEKEQGRELIASLYDDLKQDTGRITSYIEFDQEILNALNDLPGCYKEVLNADGNSSCLDQIIKHTFFNKHFVRTERTLKQLNNSGGFRILNSVDADSILALDKIYDDIDDFQNTVYQEAQDKVRSTFNSLMNFEANAEMIKPEGDKLISAQNFDSINIRHPLIFTKDKALLNRYFNELQLYSRVTFNHKIHLLQYKEYQMRLLHFLKEKYHFN